MCRTAALTECPVCKDSKNKQGFRELALSDGSQVRACTSCVSKAKKGAGGNGGNGDFMQEEPNPTADHPHHLAPETSPASPLSPSIESNVGYQSTSQASKCLMCRGDVVWDGDFCTAAAGCGGTSSSIGGKQSENELRQQLKIEKQKGKRMVDRVRKIIRDEGLTQGDTRLKVEAALTQFISKVGESDYNCMHMRMIFLQTHEASML